MVWRAGFGFSQNPIYDAALTAPNGKPVLSDVPLYAEKKNTK